MNPIESKSLRDETATRAQGTRNALGALLGSFFGALAIATSEAIALASHGPRVILVPFAAAFWIFCAAALVATGVALAAQKVVILLERRTIDWEVVLGSLGGACFSVLAAQSLVLRWLSGQGIRTAVVSFGAAIGVAAGIVLGWGLHAALKRARRAPSVRQRASILVAGGACTFVLIIALAPGFVEELDVPGLLATSAPLIFGLAGALAGADGRRLRHTIALGSVLLAILALANAVLPIQPDALRTLERHTHATRTVLGWQTTPGLMTAAGNPALPPLRKTGSCRPGLVPGPLSGNVTAPDGAPDILLITIDAVRWDHTSLAGYERETTPRLRKRAESAAVFSSAFSPASSTRQTFRALFSGLLPSQVPASQARTWWAASLPPGQRTLARYLSEAGYLTASGNTDKEGFGDGTLQGFDREIRAQSNPQTKDSPRAARAKAQLAGLLDELRTERERPLFAWTHLGVAHQPYTVDKKSPFGDEPIDRYDGAILFLDRELDQLLAALDAEQRLERTFVIITADHGQAFLEHGNRLHGYTVYQEETHVPLLVWGPGIVPGQRSEPVSILDLFPTILEFAGLGTASAVCGASLVPWLRDPANSSRQDVYMEQVPDTRPAFVVGFVRGRYKLVLSVTRGQREVFDRQTDPKELHDLSEQRPELTRELVHELMAFQRARGLEPSSYGLP